MTANEATVCLKRPKPTILEILRRYNVLLTAILVFGFSAIATKGTFFVTSNLINVGERASIIGIVAIGQTLVILSGAIDLSVGAIMSFSYTTLIVFNSMGVPFGVASVLSVLAGCFIGLINGLIVIKTSIPPFLVTLSTMLITFSVSNTILGTLQLRYSEYQAFLNQAFSLNETSARLFPTLIWLLLSAISILALSKSRLGLSIYAVGGGSKAAFLSGVRSDKIKITVYVLSGLTSAVAGLVFAYRIGFLMPNSSESFMIESMAAVVLGGTNINGGEGNIFGSFFGAAVIAALLNVLSILRINPFIQYAIMGFLLMAIVFNISNLSKRK